MTAAPAAEAAPAGGGAPASAGAPQAETTELYPGDVVEIAGLKGAAELNGQKARLWRRDASTGRWEVKLDDDTVKAIRPENLIFKAVAPLEDDGTLMLVSMATENKTMHGFIEQLRGNLPQANEALQLITHVVAPGGGGGAKGDDVKLWVKLAKQAEQKARCILEEIQKRVEVVDGIALDGLGSKAASELKMARRDLVRFAQVAQDRLEAALSRLNPVSKRLQEAAALLEPPKPAAPAPVETAPAAKRRRHGWTKETEDDLPLHEKYKEVFNPQPKAEAKPEEKATSSSLASKTTSSLKAITIKYQGKGANPPPSDNLYVKGLPGWVSEEDVRAIFVKVGEVKSMLLKTAEWGAIAFVRLANKGQTARAIEELSGTIPPRLTDVATRAEREQKTEAEMKVRFGAVVEQLERGVLVVVDLTRPLGIGFDDKLVVNVLQEDGQAAELGIGERWRARSVGGIELKDPEDLMSRIAGLKGDGATQAAIAFAPPPLTFTFEARPFGLAVHRDEEMGLIVVSEARDFAQRRGVRSGAILTRIGDRVTDGLSADEAISLLKEAPLPAKLVFEQAQVPQPKKKRAAAAAAAAAGSGADAADAEAQAAKRQRLAAAVGADDEDDDLDEVGQPSLRLTMSLSEPLGILFDDDLDVENVQDGSQAHKLGVKSGWKALRVAGKSVRTTDALVSKIEVLKASGATTMHVDFRPAALKVVFESRPFGFSVGPCADLPGQFQVGAASEAAQTKGIKAGMIVRQVNRRTVGGMSQDEVMELLKWTRLPVTVVLDNAPGPDQREANAAKTAAEAPAPAPATSAAAAPVRAKRSLAIDLTQPLGIFFDDGLMAQGIQEGSQAESLGIRKEWRALAVNGEQVDTTATFVGKIQALKAAAAASATVVFETAPLIANFCERPFGFSVGLDDECGRFTVGAVGGNAETLGVLPGMILVSIGGRKVDGLEQSGVIDLLRQAVLPCDVMFDYAPEADPNQLVVSFAERPFGFSVGLDDASGRFTVGAVGGQAEEKGVAPGMVLVSIGGQGVDGLEQDGVINLLKQASLPASVVFEPAPSAKADQAQHVVSFAERPFGFSVGLDDASRRFTVGAVGGQAEEKGIVPGMVLVSIGGQSVDGLEQDGVINLLKQADLPASVVFEPATEAQHVVSFAERPFGFSVGLDEESGRFTVGAVGGQAEEKGVAPGMVLLSIGGRPVDGLQQEGVIDLLRQAVLPASVVFEHAPDGTE